MPRIREYEQQTSAGAAIDGRRAQLGDLYAGGAVLGDALLKTSDVIQDTVDRQEVSDVQAKLAQARAQWTVHLQERAQATAPGDATFAPKFNEDFGKYLQTIEGGLQTRTGQNAFRKGAAELSAHFVEKTGVYQAQQMGAKAKQDYLVSLDARRAELLNDPTQFAALLAAAVSDINDPTGIYAKMPVAEREKLEIQTRKEMALSAVQGLIQNGAPELAKRQLQGGQWDAYLDADKKADLVRSAEVGIHAKDTAAERARMLAEREKKDRQDEAMKGLLARIIDPKANGGALSDKEILAAPLDAAHQQHLIDYKLRRARELQSLGENRRNPGEVNRLMNELIAADDDPSKTYGVQNIRDSYRSGKISTNELVFLENRHKELRDGSTNTFARDSNAAIGNVAQTVRSSINFVGREAEAVGTVERIRADFYEAVDLKRKANENPRDLLNPKSKDWFFDPAKLSTYTESPRAAVAGQAAAVRRGALAPVVPAVGTIQNGFKFKGGNPALQSSWEKVP